MLQMSDACSGMCRRVLYRVAAPHYSGTFYTIHSELFGIDTPVGMLWWSVRGCYEYITVADAIDFVDIHRYTARVSFSYARTESATHEVLVNNCQYLNVTKCS